MKKLLLVAVAFLLLTGCTVKQSGMDKILTLRSRFAQGETCAFDMRITADYGTDVCMFEMQCGTDSAGTVQFTVTEPELISGISGEITGNSGKLIFDDTILAFEMLMDGQLTPASAPWVLINAIRSGYIHSCGTDGDNIRVCIQDSYQESLMTVDLWLDSQNLPVRCDVVYAGRRILTMDVTNFRFL